MKGGRQKVGISPTTANRFAITTSLYLSSISLHDTEGSPYSQNNSDPEDLWDFGTVRHVGATIGRTQHNPAIDDHGGRNGDLFGYSTTPTPSSTTETAAYDHRQSIDQSSIANKGDHLPPIPPPPAKKYDVEATVKHALLKGSGTTRATVRREPSDEYDDYDEDFAHQEGQNGNGDTELPDTTLLDTVVLPALASV